MNALLLGIGFGLATAAVLAISTVALSLQFGVTNFPNFAHGEMMTVGAYAAYSTYQAWGNVVLSGIAAIVAGAVLGMVMNLAVIAPFRKRGAAQLTLFVLTIGISLIVQNVVLFRYGGQTATLQVSAGAPHHVIGLLLTTEQLIIIGIAIVVMLGVHGMLKYTSFGRAQRAVAESPMLAESSGINSRRIINLTWAITGSLAGLAGYILALDAGGLTPTMGFDFLLVVFAAAILGGIGQPYGAMVGAVVVGLAMEVAASYIPSDYKQVVAFAILIVALLLRPQGLIPAKGLAVA